MSSSSLRVRNKPGEFEKQLQAEMTRPHSEPAIELQPLSPEEIVPEEEVITQPSTTCLYIIPLNLASCLIAVFDVVLGLAVGTYGYYALTDKEVPKSDDDVMAKLAGVVYILLAFMIVVFSSVMFAGAILKRTDFVSPFIIVVGLMSACTALMSFTTGVAVNADENQRDEIAHQIYIWTLVIVVLQFIFIRTVNKFYKSIKEVQLPQASQETQNNEDAQAVQSTEFLQPIEITMYTQPSEVTQATESSEVTQAAQSSDVTQVAQSSEVTQPSEITQRIEVIHSIQTPEVTHPIENIHAIQPTETTQSNKGNQ